jgi:hypothetical protein
MAGYDRQSAAPVAADNMHIAMANCGRCHAHLHLASLWRIDLNLFYD